MKNIKKIIISLVISLLLVVFAQLIWNKTVKRETQVYMALKDIYKGEKINENELLKIGVKPNLKLDNCYNLNVNNKVAKTNIEKGKILNNEDLEKSSENSDYKEEYEYITVEVKNSSDSFSYQLKKDDYINVYYTSQDRQIANLIGDKEYVNGSDNTSTVRIFENIKVIGLYDETGNEIQNKGQYTTVMIRVKKEEAILISNIKTYGTFTISCVK